MSNLSCMTASRAWRAGRVIDQQVGVDELATVINDPDLLLWVDLLDPDRAALELLATELGLAATAVEDAVAPFERPKLTRHQSHTFFTTYATWADGAGLRWSRISGIVLPTALITIRLDDAVDTGELVDRWEADPALLAEGTSALVHGVLDYVVDGHFDTIQAFDEELEDLEGLLFAQARTRPEFVQRTFQLRKDLVALRRFVLPMREVVNGLLRHNYGEHTEVLRAWYDDLYDHVLRAAEWTESLRDLLTSIFETNLSLQDARLNTVMKKLAGWAAIIGVPTAITGWFGQNVPYLGFNQAYGVWLSAGLIVVSVAILYLLFKRNDWL